VSSLAAVAPHAIACRPDGASLTVDFCEEEKNKKNVGFFQIILKCFQKILINIFNKIGKNIFKNIGSNVFFEEMLVQSSQKNAGSIFFMKNVGSPLCFENIVTIF
jgi:hypothetical protein